MRIKVATIQTNTLEHIRLCFAESGPRKISLLFSLSTKTPLQIIQYNIKLYVIPK